MLGAFSTVRRGERRDTFTAFGVLFLLLASHAVLETARDALFLSKVPASRLPLVYLGMAAVSLIVAEAHSRIAGTSHRKRALAGSIAISAAVTAVFWLALASAAGGDWILYALYVWPGLVAAVILLQFWTLLGDVFTITQAKRLYGAIGVGSVGGAIAGNAIASAAAGRVDPVHLLAIAAIGFAAAGAASWLLRSETPLADPAPDAGASHDGGVGRGASMLAGHPYARRIVAIAVVTAAAVTVADYLFKTAVAAQVDAAALGGFFARVYLIVNALSLVAQVFLANLAIRKLGVPFAAALLPLAMVGAALTTLVVPLLTAVLLIKGTEGSLRHSVHRTAFELLGAPLSGRVRAQLKRLVDIAGYRAGQAAASLAILGLAAAAVPPIVIAAVLIGLSVMWLLLAIAVRRGYVELFRRSLSRGHAAQLSAFPELDAASLETVVRALDSDDDREVIAAMEVLERDDRSRLVPRLILFHPSQPVVRHALALFARTGRREVSPAIDRLLAGSPPPGLRAAALSARLALEPDPALLDRAAEAAGSEPVRAAVAVCRTAFAGADRAPIDELARTGDADTRIAIADAIAATDCAALADLVGSLGRDGDRSVRLAAIGAMSRLGGDTLVRELIALLGVGDSHGPARDALIELGPRALDELARSVADPAVGRARRDLPEIIARIDPERAAPILVAELERQEDGQLRYRLIRALEALVAQHPTLELDRAVIRRTIRATLNKAYRYLDYEMALERGAADQPPRTTPGHRLLRRLLADKRKHAVGRLFRLLGLAIPTESFAAAYRGITSSRPDLRAGGIEFLDNVLPAGLRAPVLGLIDDLSPAERLDRAGELYRPERIEYLELLARLGTGSAAALRDAALYHAGELAGGDDREGASC